MSRTDILDDFAFDDGRFFEGGNEGEVVAKYYSILEAQVAAARLRSQGIPCFLANMASTTVLPHLQLLVRLHVRPEDAPRARAILGEAAIDADEDNLPEEDSTSALTIIAIVIGIILSILLVRAIGF
ncbi:MAG: putative signal transducing protein [Saprospiraceae bacterium]